MILNHSMIEDRIGERDLRLEAIAEKAELAVSTVSINLKRIARGEGIGARTAWKLARGLGFRLQTIKVSDESDQRREVVSERQT